MRSATDLTKEVSLIEQMRARFLGRFLEGAGRRLGQARAAFATGDLKRVVIEMHSLAGEASMLELSGMTTCAKACEHAARREDAEAVERTFEALVREKDGLDAMLEGR